MLKYIIYAALAVMLGVAVMLLPLTMLNYQIGLTDSGQPQRDGAKEVFTSSSEEKTAGSIISKKTAIVQGYEGLTSRLASSLPYATFIVATGLAAAVAVLVLAKRRL